MRQASAHLSSEVIQRASDEFVGFGVRSDVISRFANAWSRREMLGLLFSRHPPAGVCPQVWDILRPARESYLQRFEGPLIVFDEYVGVLDPSIEISDIAIVARACRASEAIELVALEANSVEREANTARKDVAALAQKLREARERAVQKTTSDESLPLLQGRVVRVGDGVGRIKFCPVLERDGSTKALINRLHGAREAGDPVAFLCAWSQLQIMAHDRMKGGARVPLAWIDGIIASLAKMLEELPASAGRRSPKRKFEVFQLLVRDYLALTGRPRFPWSNNALLSDGLTWEHLAAKRPTRGIGGKGPDFLDRLSSRHPSRPGRFSTRRFLDTLPKSN